MSLQIFLLGQPRILLDEQPVELPGYRPLALLAYLIITRKNQRREHLIDLLFDGPDDPRAALRWTLSKIRKAIGDDFILTDRDEVSFNWRGDAWLDMTAFEAGEVELYQGDLLEGLYLRDAPQFEEWLLFERQRLRGMYQAGLEQQLGKHKRQGDFGGVAISAQQLLKLDNLREDWHRELMEAYARLGKRISALEQFEQCRRLLRAEWDLDPAPETVALAEAIRAGQFEPVGTPAASEINPPLSATTRAPTHAPSMASPATPQRSLPRLPLLLVGLLGAAALVVQLLTGSVKITPPAFLSDTGQEASPGLPSNAPSDLSGKQVLIHGPFYDELADLFIQSMVPLEERTGIHIKFVSASEFYLAKQLATEDLPDIVIFPQPGRLFELAKQGLIIDIKTFLDEEYLQQQYPQTFLDLATLDGKMYGVWYSVGLKSLVWYPKKAFEAKGYQTPESWDELIALSDQIVADGGTPWCIAINDYDAFGWTGTDWVEDILLRTAPPETYDAWVNHELPFNSPEIKRVFEIMRDIWMKDGYVYGGVEMIAKENFRESPWHLFEDPPECYMHKQASFAPLFFPPDVEYGEDYDFFYLPPIDAEYGRPVLGSGDVVAMFVDRPEVREVMRYFTTAESAKVMIQNGGILSPHKDTPIEWFQSPADLRFAQIVLGADAYRFDGSDLMPQEVGFGSFFRGIGDWVNGADLETVLQEIDDSWPQ